MSGQDLLDSNDLDTDEVNLFPRLNNIMQEDQPPGWNMPDDIVPRLDAMFEEQTDIDADDLLLRIGQSGLMPALERDT